MRFIDAFVYAHHRHRQGLENPGNFADCMKGRIRFMTALSNDMSIKTHAGYPGKKFRLPKPKARYPYLPNARSTTRERGNDYGGWAIETDSGTRVVDGETLAG